MKKTHSPHPALTSVRFENYHGEILCDGEELMETTSEVVEKLNEMDYAASATPKIIHLLRPLVARWVQENAPDASYCVTFADWRHNHGITAPLHQWRISVCVIEDEVIANHEIVLTPPVGSSLNESRAASIIAGLDADANLRHLARIRLGA